MSGLSLDKGSESVPDQETSGQLGEAGGVRVLELTEATWCSPHALTVRCLDQSGCSGLGRSRGWSQTT